MFAKIIFNTSAQIFGKALTASSTFIVTILISRALGEAGFGDFTKIFVFVGYFYTIADFGLNSIYVKLTNEKNQIHLLQVLLGIRLLTSATLALLAIGIALIVPYNPLANTGFSPLVKAGIIIASLTIVSQAAYTTSNAFFQKRLRYDLATIAVICGALTVLFGTFLVTIRNGGLLAYTSIYVFQGVINVAFAYLFLKRLSGHIISPKFIYSESRKVITKAWPVGIALILNLIYFRIDVFILSNTRTTFEVGIYGLAYQFFEASLTIPIFFTNSIYPTLAQVGTTNIGNFKSKISFWLKTLTAVSLLLTAFLIIIANFIPFIYQGRFRESVLSLQILALGMPFFFASALLWHALIIFGKQKFLILIYGLGAVFNLTANLIFIPTLGFIAASIITVLSEALVLILLVIFYVFFLHKQQKIIAND